MGPERPGCQECPAGKYSGVGASACLSCWDKSWSGARSTNCSCDAGFSQHESRRKCKACSPGAYKAVNGSGPCLLCPAGTFSNNKSSSSCIPCPPHSVSGAGSAECMCSIGYTAARGACTECAAGKFKSSNGTGVCTACPSHMTSRPASTSITNCTCNAGYSGADGGGCSPCKAGTYKNVTGSVECTPCKPGTYSNSTAQTIEAACTTCPPAQDGQSPPARGNLSKWTNCTAAAARAPHLNANGSNANGSSAQDAQVASLDE